MSNIHPSTLVEKGAKIARGVSIGPFCYIGPRVKIAAGCILENNVTLVGNTTLAEGNHLYPMSVVGQAPAGSEQEGKCSLGPANAIREHVTVYGGVRKTTKIGTDNLIMIASAVGAGATVGDHGIFANCTHLGANSIIEDYVRTSAFGFVDVGIRVGAYTFTAGYVHVDRDAPPFAMIQGSPYRVRGANSHNLKACGFGQDDIRALKRAFRELYNGDDRNYIPQAADRLARDKKTPACVKTLLKAIRKSSSRRSND